MLCAALLTLTLAADPKPRLDQDGEPLPKEAVQRLGSARFLVNSFAGAAFSPDGKTVYTVSGEDSSDWRQAYTSPGLVAWEVPTGKKLWQAGVDRRFRQVVADPDGKSVWVLERVKGKHDEDPDQFQRVRYSSKDGKELARTPLVECYLTPVLHSTGVMTDASHILDREGKSTALAPFPPGKEGFISAMFWSAAGERLYLAMQGGDLESPCLTAFDTSDHKQIWSTPTDALSGWCVAPDGESVVIVTDPGKEMHARKLDAKTGKELGAVELKDVTGLGAGETLNSRGEIHSHPDGKTIYLIDKEGRTIAIDVATWKTVATKVKLTPEAVFSPDGKMFLAPSGRHAALYETDTGKRLSPAVGEFRYPDHNTWLSFSPASDRLTRRGHMTDETVFEWDVTTGRQTRRVEEKGDRTEHMAISADGTKKAVVKKVAEEWRGTITSVTKPNDRPVAFKAGWSDGGRPYWSMSFTLDATHLIGYDPDRGVHIWDAKAGGKPAEVQFQKVERGWVTGEGMQISPNGQLVAVMERGRPVAQLVPPRDKWKWQVGVYEIPSGKLVYRFESSGELASFTWVDGRIAGLIDLSRFPIPFFGGEQPMEHKFKLLSLDPAAKTMREHSIDVSVRSWAAAPFGDTVAVGSSDGLRLYEASAGKLCHTFREQKRPVEVLAFSPDGRYLAAESVDGPLLVWDVRGDLTKPAKPDAAGWDRAWEALGSTEAEKGFQAVRLFALHPDDGVAELKRRFAESQPTTEEVAAAITKLDDREFAVRLRAEQQLRAMGTAAFPALAKAMAREPSEEFKERAVRLLAVDIPADRRRAERAVEALRLANTDGSRKLIAEWAKGPEKDPLTVAAKRK